MAIFDFIYAGSGSAIVYGQPTILVQNPRITTNHITDSSRDITVVQPSGSTVYFNNLNNRYDVGPSGWNANGFVPGNGY